MNGTVRLYIGGLDYRVGKTVLAELLSQHGVVPLNIVLSGKGFAFVSIADSDAERVICSLSGKPFVGRTLRVELAGPKSRGEKWRSRHGLPVSKG